MAPWAVPLASSAMNLATPRWLAAGRRRGRGARVRDGEPSNHSALTASGEGEEVRLVVKDLLAVRLVARVAEALVAGRAQRLGDLGGVSRTGMLRGLREQHD